MSRSSQLLFVNTSPNGLSDETWTKWWIGEHLPALFLSQACNHVALYQETGFSMAPDPRHPLKLLALYETNHEKLQDRDGYEKVSSEAEEDVRNYRLIQDYNPYNVNEEPSPHILTIEMNPLDRDDFEDWYQTEVLPTISQLPGYRRSKRYQLAGGCEESSETFLGSDYLTIHEVEDLSKAFASQERLDKNPTARRERHVQESEDGGGFVRRGWELIHAEGW